MRTLLTGIIALGLSAFVGATALASVSILLNGSKEAGAGPASLDPQVAASWAEFGTNVERSTQYNNAPGGGVASLKAFGDPMTTTCGASQLTSAVSAGQSVTASVQLYTAANDKLLQTGQAGLVVQFLGNFDAVLNTQQVFPLDASSAADTWIPATIGPINAPAGTLRLRVTMRLNWSGGAISGAAWWDDVQVHVNGGPNIVVNGDFETAGLAQGRPCPGYAQSPIGIDDWQGFGDQEKNGSFARDGAWSAKLGTCEAYSGIYQSMSAADEGEEVRMLAYGWNSAATPMTGTSRVGIKLEFFGNSNAPPPEQNLGLTASSTPDIWTTVALDTVVPADVGIARVVMIYVGDGTTPNSYVYIDSANAERGSAPGANQLMNDSFEDGGGGANGIDFWTEFFSNGVSQASKDCFTQFENGFCSIRASGTSVAGDYQEIAVTPGESLHIDARFLTPSGTNQLTGSGTAGVKVEWKIGGLPPGPIDIGVPNASPNTIGAGAPTNTWLPLTIDYTMPPGTNAGLRFVEIIETGSGTAGAYLDAAECVIQNRFNGCDSDDNGVEDMLDFSRLQRALAGSGVAPTAWPWLVFDSDADNDVDLTDSAYFLPRLTGP